MTRAGGGGAPAQDRPAPLVLVVAGWYPAADARTAGRFVADQVAALAATGRIRPVVLAFDPLPVWGSRGLRTAQREAVAASVEHLAGHGWPGLLSPLAGTTGASGPVARLPVPAPDAATPTSRIVEERAAALIAAAEAIVATMGPVALVHAHRCLPEGAAAGRLARHLGVPLVVTEHASTLPAIAADPTRRPFFLEATASAAAVIAVSRTLAADILRIDPDAAPRVQIVPNVVHVEDFAPTEPVPRVPGELLYAGFRKTSKGIDTLLEGVRLAAAERPGLRLRLVGPAGPPPDERRWRAIAGSMPPGSEVVFEGEADRAGVAAAMARADLFVHPSPRETFGVVAAEALAAGLPVVAADSGGVTEILQPDAERYGRIVPPGDPAALAHAILDVLANREAFSAEAASARASARFSSASVAGRLLELYAAQGVSVPGDAPAGHSVSTGDMPGDIPAPPAPLPGPTIVVGLGRQRAQAILGGLPPDILARIALVTSDAPPVALPPALGRIVPVAGAAARHATLDAIATTPGATGEARRRRLRARPLVLLRELLWRLPWRERRLLARTHDAIRAAVAATGSAPAMAGEARVAVEAPVVVPLDAFDTLAADRLVRDGALRPAPGAGRWLGDQARPSGPAGPEAEGKPLAGRSTSAEPAGH